MFEVFVKFLHEKELFEKYTSQSTLPIEKTLYVLGWKRSHLYVLEGICWKETKEGEEFWRKVHNEWLSHLQVIFLEMIQSISQNYIR